MREIPYPVFTEVYSEVYGRGKITMVLDGPGRKTLYVVRFGRFLSVLLPSYKFTVSELV